jgi:hypothetical protein
MKVGKLPRNLNLSGLDDVGNVLISATSRPQDDAIQILFVGEPEDSFRIRVSLNNSQYIESFTL